MLALALGIFTTSAIAGPGPQTWPTGFPTVVKTEAAVMKCCRPKEKVALACKDCKTVSEKSGEEKKGILGWLKADSTHGCSGCSGKVTVREMPAGQGTTRTVSEYKHVCSKCGADSAFICATHKG